MYHILMLFFLLISINLKSAEPMKCNGYEELCSKRYNEVAYVNSHDATTNIKSPFSDQDRSITKQLSDGVRWIKIPLHMDYLNPAGYYKELLQALSNYVDQLINTQSQEITRGKRVRLKF